MNAKACEECRDRLLDLLDGGLEESVALRLRGHLKACAACQAEHDWLTGVAADLDALGQAVARSVPALDLVDAVLRAAEAEDRRAAAEAAWRSRRTATWRWAAGLAGAAAAATLVFFVWFQWDSGVPATSGSTPVASNPATGRIHPSATRPTTPAGAQDINKALQLLALESAPLKRQRPPGPEQVKSTESPDLRAMTLNDIAQMRRRAVADEEARAQLVRWATLTEAEARKLLERDDLSIPALVGVAESLEASEAAPLLLAAVGRYPDDPYLRFALAKTAASAEVAAPNPLTPDTEIPQSGGDPAQEQWLDAWQALDPENALPYYLEAQMLLEGGNVEAAMDLLLQAQELPRADVYAQEGALAREQALVASGMAPDAAHLLAALTAGNNEYNFLYTLSNDLLEYGRTYAEQNYLPEAQRVFEAVGRLGEQVQTGSDFSLVESAGLYIQEQALLGLEGVYAALNPDAAVEQIRAGAEELLSQVEALDRYLNELSALFLSDDVDWLGVADMILQNGDLNLLDYLSPAGQ